MAVAAPPRHRLAAILAVIGAAAGLLVAMAAPAGAHSDAGTMTITTAEQIDPTTVRVEAGIVFANDGHLALDASVSATLTGPAGATVGPTPLAKQPGNTSLYRADIAVPGPGSWAVAVSSTDPTSQATATVEVAAQPSTTTGPSTTSTPPTTASGAATASAAPGTTGAQLSAASAAAPTSDAGGSTSSAALIVVAVVAVVALGVGGVVLARRRSA